MSNHISANNMPKFTYIEAEYDHDNNRVVTLKTARDTLQTTHNPRVLGAKTEWVQVETRYPEGYDPRFDSLLNIGQLSFTYDPKKNMVIVEFPEADFSVDAVRRTLRDMINQQANNELRNTDWYVIRKMETGKPIPADVSATRDGVRAKANRYTAELASAPDSELNSFSVSFGEEPQKPATTEEPVAKGGDGKEWRTDATAPGQEGNPIHPVEEAE